MKRRIFDNGMTTISYCPAGASASETVIVTFAEMGPVDVERPGFGELFLNKRGYDVISVQKRKENWYQDLSIEDLKQAVSEIIGRYKTVFTYGSSMGGYAALYFASAVGGRALSFSPRHHSYYALVGMHAYANQFEPNHLPLQDVADPGQEHLILVDPLQPIDGPYVLREVVPSFPKSTILNLEVHRSPVHVRSRAWRRSAEFRRGLHRGTSRQRKAAAEQSREIAAIPAHARKGLLQEGTHGDGHGPVPTRLVDQGGSQG